MNRVSDDQLADWCRRLKGGDRAALSALFEAAYAPLVRYARGLTAESKVPAEDVVQEAFIRLWKRRGTLDPDRSLKALLYTTVRHRAYNRMRDTSNRQTLLDTMSEDRPAASGGDGPDPAEAADAELLGARLRAWIAELPERRREAFRLSRFDQLSYREIAEVMDVSVRTVENHVRLALQQLRDQLRAFEPERLRFHE